MSPLERRYRWLLRLLPAAHREARGEEFLGLLLDLDEGRDRPSLRQATGVVGLALRLRLAAPGALLLTAFIVAACTGVAVDLGTLLVNSGHAIVLVPGAPPVRGIVMVVVVPAVMWLAVPVAWVLGARRAALVGFTALTAYQVYGGGPGALSLRVIALLALLAGAQHRRWQPGGRGALLVTVPLAVVLWVLTVAWGYHGIPDSPAVRVLGEAGWLPSITALTAICLAAANLRRGTGRTAVPKN